MALKSGICICEMDRVPSMNFDFLSISSSNFQMWHVPRDETEHNRVHWEVDALTFEVTISKTYPNLYVRASLTPRRNSYSFSLVSVSHTRISVPFSDAVASFFPSALIARATTLPFLKVIFLPKVYKTEPDAPEPRAVPHRAWQGRQWSHCRSFATDRRVWRFDRLATDRLARYDSVPSPRRESATVVG